MPRKYSPTSGSEPHEIVTATAEADGVASAVVDVVGHDPAGYVASVTPSRRRRHPITAVIAGADDRRVSPGCRQSVFRRAGYLEGWVGCPSEAESICPPRRRSASW
jgi:hypothetical protein